MRNYCFLFLFLLVNVQLLAQPQTKRILFLGNSYTGTNNLPGLVAQIAASTGDILIYDSYTPGGYTFKLHTNNQTSLAKIASGNWDAVVLQEQSQLPSFPPADVESEVFPYAKRLDSLVHLFSACAETFFYRTWGRRNGDEQFCSSWPPVCTYQGMDSLLALRYEKMALQNNAAISPVGEVWKYLRQHSPQVELYVSDGSHPSLAGSYAAACCFYTVLFRRDPTQVTFNSGLPPLQAQAIRSATKSVVFDSLLRWYVGSYDPQASFAFTQLMPANFNFINNSQRAEAYLWYFGDQNTSVEENPTHVYERPGQYNVSLVAMRCGRKDSSAKTITVPAYKTGEAVYVYSNPAMDEITLVKNHSSAVSYFLFNNLGQRVRAGNLREVMNKLSLKDLSAGAYNLIFFDAGKKLQTMRLVKTSK